ncbi:MAG: GDSL-type esterase/lipase family protein [Verrucomicrobiales bacterium]|nr:GDSL-type esterase/lipase family protein [Verrucomicrobiales bacterium]
MVTSTPRTLSITLTVWLTAHALTGMADTSIKLGAAHVPMPSPSERHTKKVAAVKTGDYDLVLIGDSITHTLDDFGGKYAPLTAVWKKHYAPHKAINLGYSGFRTEQVLWNLQNGELDFTRSPKVAMLLIGTNNTDERHFKKADSPEDVYAGTKAIVDCIKDRHPTTKILVLRIFPRGGDDEKSISEPHFNSSAACIEICRRAGELTKQLADGKQVFWLDVNNIFLNANGTINTDLMWDLLHPSPKGAEAWSKAVAPSLARLLAGEFLPAVQTLPRSNEPNDTATRNGDTP